MKNRTFTRAAVVKLALSLGILTIPSIIQASEEKIAEPIIVAGMALNDAKPVSSGIAKRSGDVISVYQVLAGGLLGVVLVSRRNKPPGMAGPGTDSRRIT